MIYIGIDPGLGGGIAFIDNEGGILAAIKMPLTESDILRALTADLVSLVHFSAEPRRAILELVRSSPAMGVASAFTFGRGYGGLRMALTAAMIPFDEVTPPVWQAAMQCRTGGDKNISKRRAEQLFPTVKVTHAIADALLLAEFGRRKERAGFLPTRKATAHDGQAQSSKTSHADPGEDQARGEGNQGRPQARRSGATARPDATDEGRDPGAPALAAAGSRAARTRRRPDQAAR